MPVTILRDWQIRCKASYREKMAAAGDQLLYRAEACVGAGKSTMMADLAHGHLIGDFVEELPLDYCVFVAPSTSICGWHTGLSAEAAGIIGALERRGIYAGERITAEGRMPGVMECPEAKQSDAGIVNATLVCTYQYFMQPAVQETLQRWTERGLRIGYFFDEIHHLPDAPTAWTDATRSVAGTAPVLTSWSGTWFRTDKTGIYTQSIDRPDFSYPYSDGIQDGIVRPLSFWILKATAELHSVTDGELVDQRPVGSYLEDLPPEVRKELFNPDGDFVERGIICADQELVRRREKYSDAGCLIVCPPGFQHEIGVEKTRRAEDRTARKIFDRIVDLTGRRAVLVLNGDPASKLIECREDPDIWYVVAVNRVSEGCDIPRLRMCLMLRDIQSELMMTQICGRIIRRRPGEDGEPGLVIMPPIHSMAQFARQVLEAEEGAIPKPCPVCPQCGRVPCKCPCPQCGCKPCRCPCRNCLRKPCVCPDVPSELFATISGEGESHITEGEDIDGPFAARAMALRNQVAACSYRDLAGLAYILQKDEEVNGKVDRVPGGRARRTDAVRTAADWQNLRDSIPGAVTRLAAKMFGQRKDGFREVWGHINRKFFPGSKWTAAKDSPDQLPVEKLNEIAAYIERITKTGGFRG